MKLPSEDDPVEKFLEDEDQEVPESNSGYYHERTQQEIEEANARFSGYKNIETVIPVGAGGYVFRYRN